MKSRVWDSFVSAFFIQNLKKGAGAYDCKILQLKYQKSKSETEDFKMNENKENVKVLTKEDVIKLSNNTKRQEFLSDYESWGVWLDIPELGVGVFKAELPNKVMEIYH